MTTHFLRHFTVCFECVLIIALTTLSCVYAATAPDQGPSGPILVVASSANPFTKYYAEILRAEGLNAFAGADISTVSAATLAQYDVVILGEIPLTSTQVTMFSDYVTSGGNLIAMRPDKKLAGLFGLTATTSTLSDKYLLIDNSTTAGAGLVSETIQFHGTADLYTTSGATTLATLYFDATTPTANPAVTWQSVGPSGGQAAAFTFDLARSIVYTRQGNPAWRSQLRDATPGCQVGQVCASSVTPPIRAYDLFYGKASFDPQPDWIDLNKVAIPQADEQQRFLANLILLMNLDKKPLPRFWYFPRGNKAAVIMTGDDHANGGTAGRFDSYISRSPAGCSVANWECIRSTSYIYPSSPLTSAQAAAYTAAGFEVALHVTTNCTNYTSLSSLASIYGSQLSSWQTYYSSVPAPSTNRTHCVVWSDYSTQPQVELLKGIRLDTTYYYWPGSWILDRPGFFNGSGMPMRFAASDGTMIDVYQAVTQMTDESAQTYPFEIDSLLDKAIGPEAYYGAFTANMHTDQITSVGSDAIVGAALFRGVPIVSAKQMLTWLDGRNNSFFGSLMWNGSTLSFTIAADPGANGMQAMLPTVSMVGPLAGIMLNGSPVSFTRQTIKGIEYAVFSALSGAYQVSYTVTTTPPDTIITSSSAALTNSTSATFSFTSTKAESTFACSLDGSAFAACSNPKTYTGLALGSHNFQVRAIDLASNTDPTPASYSWSISTVAVSSFTDTTVANFSAGTLDANTYIAQTADGEVTLAPAAGAEFSGAGLPAGWFSTAVSAGGSTLISGGIASLDGTLIGASTLFEAGDSLEFVATFSGAANQHIGFGVDLNNPPWAIFSTYTGGNLYARTNNGATVLNTMIPGSWLGTAHRYRIDWNASNVVFSIDSNVVAIHTISFTNNMRPVAADAAVGGGIVSVDWLRMTPYAASGTFLSRVFDAATDTSTWGTVSWGGNTPAGTTLAISVRLGNTPVPDGTWTTFAPLAGSGAAISGRSRYLQYRAQLTTTVPTQTPSLNNITISYAGGVDTTPPDTSITTGPSSVTNSTTASFGFASTKAGSTFACSLDGSAFTACSSPKSYTGLMVSTHTFQVRATDSFGNTDPTPASSVWTIDITPPDTTITAGSPAITTSSVATFSFTSTKAGSTFGCSLDGSAFVACTSPTSYNGLAVSSHTFQVRATDGAGNIDPTPASFSWTISTASLSSFTDTTVADFSAGTLDRNTYISQTTDGEMILAPTVGAEFSGSALPAGWFSTALAAGGSVVVNGGVVTVDGVLIGTNSVYGPGRSLEFVATFSGQPYQHVGFGVDLNSAPWAIFSTAGGGDLYARTSNGTTVTNTLLAGTWLGTAHRYRIDWNATNVVFSIDGNVVATHSVSFTAAMRPLAADLTVGGGAVSVDWLRMTPYAASGTFSSRIFDAGSTLSWGTATWSNNTPAGTSITISVRQGNTAVPDGTWTAFTSLTSSGAAISGTSRYLQYQAVLTTTDANQTPALNSISFNAGVVSAPNPVPSGSGSDTTVADFSAGTVDGTTYISQATDGEVILAPTVGAEFSGSALPAGWFITVFSSGGSASASGGVVGVDGAMIGTSALYGAARSLEFVASFSGAAYQHVGFGVDLNNPPWAIFSTGSGGALYARTNNGVTTTNTLIPGSWLGTVHRYRIDWNLSTVVFSIDGVQVAIHSIAISRAMRPVVADLTAGGGTVSVDWLRMTAYAASGTFLSRVFDAGVITTWGTATWTGTTPAGTSLMISVRQGNAAVPDSTWTAFTPLASSGAAITGTSRYLQYRAVLTSADPGQTPSLDSIIFK